MIEITSHDLTRSFLDIIYVINGCIHMFRFLCPVYHLEDSGSMYSQGGIETFADECETIAPIT